MVNEPLSSELKGILDFALAYFERDGAVRMADAYKWLFQATRGGEHAMIDEERARLWLDQEWATLTAPYPNEEVIEPLRPDGALVRLHLRPYQAQSGRKDPLLSAFILSSKSFQSPQTDFIAVWQG